MIYRKQNIQLLFLMGQPLGCEIMILVYMVVMRGIQKVEIL